MIAVPSDSNSWSRQDDVGEPVLVASRHFAPLLFLADGNEVMLYDTDGELTIQGRIVGKRRYATTDDFYYEVTLDWSTIRDWVLQK